MEPERPIEKMLRAFAKKRRDEAREPFELHPASRRMLQGEVARKFAKSRAPEKQSFLQVLIRTWPRMAWGFAVIGLVGVLAGLLIPALNRPKTRMLAKNDEITLVPSLDSLNEPAPAAAPAGTAKEVNGTSGQSQLADNSSLFDLEKQKAHKVEQTAGEKDSLLTLNQRATAETPLTVKTESRAESREQEFAKMPARGDGLALADSDRAGGAPALRRSDLPSQTFAPTTVPQSSVAPAPAAPGAASSSPTALGGALASRSLANSTSAPQPPSSSIVSANGGLAGAAPTKKFKEESLAAAKPVVPPAESTPPASLETASAEKKFAFYADDLKNTVTNSQRFAQVMPGGNRKTTALNKSAPTQNLLVSFQLEQNGRDVRILDEDGSVYKGYLQLTNAATRLPEVAVDKSSTDRFYRQRGGGAEAKLQDQVAQNQNQAIQNVIFRVAGTNRSLKQHVVFTGMLLPATNVDFLSTTTNSFGNSSLKLGTENFSIQNGDLGTLQWFNTTISGKAQVGTQKEIEIKAVPISR